MSGISNLSINKMHNQCIGHMDKRKYDTNSSENQHIMTNNLRRIRNRHAESTRPVTIKAAFTTALAVLSAATLMHAVIPGAQARAVRPSDPSVSHTNTTIPYPRGGMVNGGNVTQNICHYSHPSVGATRVTHYLKHNNVEPGHEKGMFLIKGECRSDGQNSDLIQHLGKGKYQTITTKSSNTGCEQPFWHSMDQKDNMEHHFRADRTPKRARQIEHYITNRANTRKTFYVTNECKVDGDKATSVTLEKNMSAKLYTKDGAECSQNGITTTQPQPEKPLVEPIGVTCADGKDLAEQKSVEDMLSCIALGGADKIKPENLKKALADVDALADILEEKVEDAKPEEDKQVLKGVYVVFEDKINDPNVLEATLGYIDCNAEDDDDGTAVVKFKKNNGTTPKCHVRFDKSDNKFPDGLCANAVLLLNEPNAEGYDHIEVHGDYFEDGENIIPTEIIRNEVDNHTEYVPQTYKEATTWQEAKDLIGPECTNFEKL